MSANPPNFVSIFNGALYGVLQWEKLDALWQRTLERADEGWYIYAVGESVPDKPATAATLATAIHEIDALLRREHKEDYCGIVYADNLDAPRLIKIYDPNNLGVTCGFSTNPPLPGWVLSTLAPVKLERPDPVPAGRRRWWHRLIRRA